MGSAPSRRLTLLIPPEDAPWCFKDTGHAETTMSLMPDEKNDDHSCDQALHSGAGDENRTRTIGSGSSAINAASDADQAFLAVPSDPGSSLAAYDLPVCGHHPVSDGD